MLERILGVIFLFLTSYGYNQTIVNGYAEVASISGTIVTLSSVDESYDTFENGDKVIIFQMQDDVIGSNTSDNSSFGNLSDIKSAGLFEVATIATHSETSGIPTTLILSSSLSNTFNTGSNSSVQIVSYPTFGSPDYTTVSDLTASPWDGTKGGIIAFNVDGTLTLEHDISANYLGFRGADANGGGSTSCSGGSNFRLATNDNHSDKGEGIYKSTNTDYNAGMGHLLTGGGGGNSHNAGGGGGSNFTTGGQGGEGWPVCSPSAGGYGGTPLNSDISTTRFVLGGGGGAGEANNGGGQNGGAGGGIVFITANEIITTGTCSSRSITANGQSMTTLTVNDANSGGGGGGSVYFYVDTWNVSSTCPLVAESNGGDGGAVDHAHHHGGGGGGGLGAIIYALNEPTTNVTSNTIPGSGGKNCNTCSSAPNGNGTNGDGIIRVAVTLPVELVSFTTQCDDKVISLIWKTATEVENEGFYVQSSLDGENWANEIYISGMGNTNRLTEYEVEVPVPSIPKYYRLKQIDFDGIFTFSKSLQVDCSAPELIKSFPNPTKGLVHLVNIDVMSVGNLVCYDAFGKQVNPIINRESYSVSLDFKGLKAGFYTLVLQNLTGKMESHKVLLIN